MPSLDQLAPLLRATLEDAARITSLMNTTMQQAPHPAFELSREGVIWYLNTAAAETLGVNPNQAVGTRLTNYVKDGLMTQRRLDTLKQQPQSETWPDHWRKDNRYLPCRMTAFPIPDTFGMQRPRVILWSESSKPKAKGQSSSLEDTTLPHNFLSGKEHILGQDLDAIVEFLGVKIHRLCEQLGVTTHTWYVWRRAANIPISSRITELHLRLLAAMPDLTQMTVHPIDLQEALKTQRGIDLALTDIALLLGIEARSAYAWAHGSTISAQIQALTSTLMVLLVQKPRQAWDQYCALVNNQAALEGVNIWETKSWTPIPDMLPILDESAASTLKRGGRRSRFQAATRYSPKSQNNIASSPTPLNRVSGKKKPTKD